jgi:PPOX class probable F420-dependent enzyme
MELSAALDFLRPRRQGIVTTIRRDGRPQLSNIAFHLGDDDVIRVSITDGRAKTKNLRRDPRVSLYSVRDDFYAYVVVDGTAELSAVAGAPDDAAVDELVELYRSLAGDHPDWDEYRRAMVADRRLVLRIHPERAYGMM